MADIDTLGLQPAPTLQFELEQQGDYSQYLLHTRSEILAVLRALIEKNTLITVHFDEGRAFFLTSMIALTADNAGFLIDAGSDQAMNVRALKAAKLIFTALLDKVKIQFSLSAIKALQHEGRAAFSATLPNQLLRLQRREYFRLSMPVANPVKLNTHIAPHGLEARPVDIPLLDISGGGIGLMTPVELAKAFERGQRLENCKILLPNEGLLVTTLCVRNSFDVTTRSGAHYVRIGCEFVDLSPARLSMVQRYIIRIERERKARLSGLG